MVGDRIRERREVLGMTKSQLAREVGVEPAAVGQWESGQIKDLKLPNLFAAAKALKVEPRWLAIEEGPMEAAGTIALDQEELAAITALRDAKAGAPEFRAAMLKLATTERAEVRGAVVYILNLTEGSPSEPLGPAERGTTRDTPAKKA